MEVFKNNVSLEATPTSDTHVANKKYVDETVESLLDDTSIRSDKTWSSEKISKINVKDAKKVDSKPTYSAGTITYVKDGISYTTTNDKQWFYYFENGGLKQTVFIDGEELTIDGASVDFDEYVKKTSIAETIDSTCTNAQVAGAKAVYDLNKRIFSLPNGTSILDYADNIDTSNDNVEIICRIMDAPDAPYGITGTVSNDCYYTFKKLYANNNWCSIESKDIRANKKYIRTKTDGKWYDWIEVLTQSNEINLCNFNNGGHSAIVSWVDDNSGDMCIAFDLIDKNGNVTRIQFNNSTGRFYMFKFDGTNWNYCGNYCMTNVNNVSPTSITPTFPDTITVSKSYIVYSVKNGWANVQIALNINATSSALSAWVNIASGLPKPDKEINTSSFGEKGTSSIGYKISTDGNLHLISTKQITTVDWWNVNFSYPVAE